MASNFSISRTNSISNLRLLEFILHFIQKLDGKFAGASTRKPKLTAHTEKSQPTPAREKYKLTSTSKQRKNSTNLAHPHKFLSLIYSSS